MKLGEGNHISVLFADQTAGNYATVEEAEQIIAMNISGELMGPHGDPTAPLEIWEVDKHEKRVRKLRVQAKITIGD